MSNTCNAGCCETANANPATTCNDHGGVVCDVNGTCVACLTATDCPATTTACVLDTCDPVAHTCGTTNTPAGVECTDSGGTLCTGSGKCVPATCTDGFQSGTETDVDCGGGGPCGPCANTKMCLVGTDCLSGFCSIGLVCAACASDSECSATQFCDLTNHAGTCTATKAAGAPCTGTDECASGFCADGVCCDTACTGTCQACTSALTGSPDGTCASVTPGMAAPAGQCVAAEPCGNDGTCATGGTCAQTAAGTSCGPPSCVNGMQTAAATCDGDGTCSGDTSPCTPYACGTAACKTACATDVDCAARNFCWLGACVRLTAVAEGWYHTCALTSAGGVQCWGSNAFGQLGNNSTADSPVPVAVVGLSSGVAAITAGQYHTCALTAAGAVLCWGYNDAGQLGNNSTTQSTVPVPVSGLASGVVAIGAGGAQSCAVTKAGALYCWGNDHYGAFCDNGGNDTNPVPVLALSSGVSAVAVGTSNFACVLMTSGGVQCCGYNINGELGNNTTTYSRVPVQVSGLTSGVTAISAGGFHACAVTTGGGVQCWGADFFGQLGDNSTTDSPVPVAPSGLTSGVTSVSAGYGQSCAVTKGGGVLCWGYNRVGELGDNSTTESNVPVAVSGLSFGVVAVAASGVDGSAYSAHTCALTTGGAALCWGDNVSGDLGDNSTMPSLVPVAIVEP